MHHSVLTVLTMKVLKRKKQVFGGSLPVWPLARGAAIRRQNNFNWLLVEWCLLGTLFFCVMVPGLPE